ncbi:MAG: hypothetical protein C0505_16360 [Leptothrix sp. (in: Bacteria)]|nr:hypothetical protein [Leptothrix sp. (in: b-proteobacteria)]
MNLSGGSRINSRRFIMSIFSQVSVALALVTAISGASALTNPRHHFNNGECFYGQALDAPSSARTIDLSASKHINAEYGEVLRFVSGGKTFTWQFNGLDRLAVDLQLIAPDGFDAKSAKVHVAPNPLTRW